MTDSDTMTQADRLSRDNQTIQNQGPPNDGLTDGQGNNVGTTPIASDDQEFEATTEVGEETLVSGSDRGAAVREDARSR